MTVISLPDRDETVTQAVDAAWENLEAVEDLEQLKYERKKAKVKAALEGITDEEVFAEIQSRRGGAPREDKKVKVAELETLIASKDELGDDKPDGNFFARSLPRTGWISPGWGRSNESYLFTAYARSSPKSALLALSPPHRIRTANWKWGFAVRHWPERSVGCRPSKTKEKECFSNFGETRSRRGRHAPDVLRREANSRRDLVAGGTSIKGRTGCFPACLI